MRRVGQRRLAGLLAALLASGLAVGLSAGAAQARDTLAVVGQWGAFRDSQVPRCYAIARPTDEMGGADSGTDTWHAFAAIGYWPRKGVRGQINLRLSRVLAPDSKAELVIGDKHFVLVGGGADVWAKDRRDDAAIVAAIRSGGTMRVYGRGQNDRRFFDSYELRGAATAIDAAALGCAHLK